MLRLETLTNAIDALSACALALRQQETVELARACEWLTAAPDAETLRARLAGPPQEGESLAALPVTDALLTQTFTTEALPPAGAVVIGVDGSQIPPDRHAPVLYYLLQVGGLIFRYNGQTPTEHSAATLHFEPGELYDEEGLLIGAQLGMRRTVREMEYLATLAEQVGGAAPILALTDGPLLWPYSGRSPEEATAFPAYLAALTRLREAGGLPVGFVERPGGRPLLELLRQSQDAPESAPPGGLPALTDHTLMAQVLPPGARSVWLKRPTPTNERHARAGHTIWFCYLNVGEPDYPVIARLEVPAWAAEREPWTEMLHAALLHQARLLGGNPYVLARAHEVALVTHQDKAALEDQLLRRLLEQGIVARPSEKARQKGLLGKKG